MRKFLLLIILISSISYADEITFSKANNVTLHQAGVFHHLDTPGRKNISANHEGIAVVWEDNRTGKPHVYMAFKRYDQKNFAKTITISNTDFEAYEPTIITYDKQQFLLAWEQNGQVWISLANDKQVGKAVLLDSHNSSQVTLTMTPQGKTFACWIQNHRPNQQVVLSEITLKNKQLKISQPVIVDKSPAPRRQSYPSVTATQEGIAIGWEDREHGHTRIYTSFSADGKNFTGKKLLNDLPPSRSVKYGRGTGATRVALASDKKNMVVASWMDKRNFVGGYDIFAAVSSDGGRTYGKDEIVQDMLGENQPQWHPAVAINQQGKIYVAWDDPRDDSADIWLSYRQSPGWSDDQLVTPASGKGQQSNPSITFDPAGHLHIVWLDQTARGSRLRYAHQQ
ncbi:MAG: hypothetical protein P8Y24_00760 [Gammaproteobacteria bacterium]